MTNDSIEVAKISVKMAMSTREEENELKKEFAKDGFKVVAVDVGGKFPEVSVKILERALVASKKNGLIADTHLHDGSLVGATREALSQIASKTHGLSAGGKIGVARKGEHISVAIFMSMGILHLNDIVIGLGHRSIPD